MIYKKILFFLAVTTMTQALSFEEFAAKFDQKQVKRNLRKGSEFVEKRCVKCHVSPTFVAQTYTKKEWKRNFNKTLDNLTKEDMTRNKFYIKHQTNEGIFGNLIDVLNNSNAKKFLLHNAKEEKKKPPTKGYDYIFNPPKAK